MLPFYKTFPFMDYYKNEEAFAKDLRMIKDMYPLDTAMIQSAVEQRMDELEYEGSFISYYWSRLVVDVLSMMRCLTGSVFSMRQTGLPADLSQSKAAGALSVQ